jgi:hypothetical protein
MADPDLDDFITINITCDQAVALVKLLLAAHETGLFDDVLNQYEQDKLTDFAATMSMEIQNQKTGVDE